MARAIVVALLLGCLVFPISLWAQSGSLRQFTALELLDIDNSRNEKGERLPPEVLPDLRESLLHAIVGMHRFARVEDYRDPKAPEAKSERVVQMRVKVTGYTGAQNNAGVSTLIHFIDKESGHDVLNQNVSARLHYDQGALTSALRKLARSVVDMMNANW